MLDLKEIRSNIEGLRRAVRIRRVPPDRANVDRWIELDKKRRHLMAAVERLNAEKKSLAGVGKIDPIAAREKGQSIREWLRQAEEELNGITGEWKSIIDWFPNWPHPAMPEGAGPEDNVEEAAWVPGGGYVPNVRGLHSRASGRCRLFPRTQRQRTSSRFTTRNSGRGSAA